MASTHHGLACILVAAEGAGDNQRLLHDVVELIRVARRRAPRLPIFALGEQVTIENAPAEAMADLNELRGLLYSTRTPCRFWPGRSLGRRATTSRICCRRSSEPLVQHTGESITPGTRRGHGGERPIARVRSARRSISFSAKTRCARISVSVPELGSLLDHTSRWPPRRPVPRAISARIIPSS